MPHTTTCISDPAITAQIKRLDVLLHEWHAGNGRRPVPDTTPERALADLSAAIDAYAAVTTPLTI